ncbi:hypothetical protein LMG22465_07290 [Lactobacillus helveticus]|nr:hypothetical protein LMG22465_07290 [Lactobacillus helveticus]
MFFIKFRHSKRPKSVSLLGLTSKSYLDYQKIKAFLEAIRYVDLVIPENNWEQKINDMHKYHITTFVMGDNWKGKFDFLTDEGVNVIYLPRTPKISTSKIKKDLKLK